MKVALSHFGPYASPLNPLERIMPTLFKQLKDSNYER